MLPHNCDRCRLHQTEDCNQNLVHRENQNPCILFSSDSWSSSSCVKLAPEDRNGMNISILSQSCIWYFLLCGHEDVIRSQFWNHQVTEPEEQFYTIHITLSNTYTNHSPLKITYLLLWSPHLPSLILITLLLLILLVCSASLPLSIHSPCTIYSPKSPENYQFQSTISV